MKVKDLKAILEGCNDELDVLVGDCADNYVRTSTEGGEETVDGVIALRICHEFPKDWYDADGKEKRCVYGVGDIVLCRSDYSEITISDEDLFGTTDDVSINFDFYDGEAKGEGGVRMSYPKIDELTDEQIAEIDRYCGGRIKDSKCLTPYDVAIKYGKVELVGIMHEGSGRDDTLVKEINRLWAIDKAKFRPILVTLYKEQIGEITDNDSFQEPQWKEWEECKKGVDTGDWSDYNARALSALCKEWDFYAESYLEHVSDDADLERILYYVKNGKDRKKGEMIELDHISDLICESVQEITIVAWPIIYGKDNQYNLNGSDLMWVFRRWGEEFEDWWLNGFKDEEWEWNWDYLSEVHDFAEKKAAEYIKGLQ